MQDFLTFDEMVTPKIITLVYWLLLVIVVLVGLSSIFAFGISLGSLFRGVIGIVLGVLGVRIWCELLIVMFKMNEALQEIRKKKQ